ncbi:MAG: GGDEF domain-containing protein [Candidatus Devosia phytovorans]|uniref:diguanylate cyclase n=1 Tax=Candidatus Devosia phytovorans TaxID=3121372 RepID=A0AAJ5VR12_9HYPH|nr:GGDEF domain-containing protein [Devosia sp.]WEK03044.1 MAG: GGDEF domain-containing protein [Devosia sp.]
MDTFSNFAFLLPISMALFGIVFLVLGTLGQETAKAWGLAFIFGALSYIAPLLPVPVQLQALFGNATILVSFFYYGEALLRHFNAPRRTSARVIFCLFAYAAITGIIVGLNNLALELTVSDIAVSLLLGVPLAMVLPQAKSPMDRVLVTVAGIVVLDIVVRLFVFNVVVGLSADLADFAGSSYTYYMQVSVGVLSVAFALAGFGSVAFATLDQYRSAAEQDPLTNLLNRRGFDRAAGALTMAQRLGGVVMACDIDSFKQVNDSFGHASGDQVLRGLADLLTSRLPGSAVVARFGGEEFVVFLPDMPLASGAALGQSIRAEFSARDWRQADVPRQITMSIGVAAPLESEGSVHDALARADRALYAAKSGGRNRVMIDAGEAYMPELRIVPAAESSAA